MVTLYVTGQIWSQVNFDFDSQFPQFPLSESPGLVDFAIGLVKSVFNLPDGQVMFFEEFE